jgi:hypothetical protein
VDLDSLRNYCSSLYFSDADAAEDSGRSARLYWTEEVWTCLLGRDRLSKGIGHLPLSLQRVIFCTHTDVALLDTPRLPEIESGTPI